MDSQPRCLVLLDIPALLRIEATLHHPWDERTFCSLIRRPNMAGMVLELEDQIVAYLLYEVYDHHLEVIRFAVHPEFRRQGLGRKMLSTLADKLAAHRRAAIAVDIWDWDTPTQLWLKACGFAAIKVVATEAGDRYRFVFRAPVEAQAAM